MPVMRVLSFLLALLVLAPAHATCSAVPFAFAAGTTAQSGQVNADFSALVSCINALDTGQITSGTLTTARGGTNHGNWSTGSVLYAASSTGVSEDNSNLFWDATNHRLGIGTAVPSGSLHVFGAGSILGSNAGSTATPTAATANLLLYKVSTTNYSGIMAATGGEMCFITGLVTPLCRLILGVSGEVQLTGFLTTNGILSTSNLGVVQQTGSPSVAANGYTKLPGGLTLQWGTVNFAASTTAAVTFPIAFPTTVFAMFAEAGGGTPMSSAASTALSGATITASASNSESWSWYAIGN